MFLLDTHAACNYARLACLLIQEGTIRIRTVVLNSLEHGHTLTTALVNNKSKFDHLRRKNVLSAKQFSMLYPDHGSCVRRTDLDMTIWLTLARNITKQCSEIKWTVKPSPHDTQWQHDVIRLRETRNELFHINTPELDDAKFRELLDDVSIVLLRLGTPDDVIDDHVHRDLDPGQSAHCVTQVRQQSLEELHSLYLAQCQQSRHNRCVVALLAVVLLTLAVTLGVTLTYFLTLALPCEGFAVVIREKGTFKLMHRVGWGAQDLPHVLPPAPNLHLPTSNIIISETGYISNDCDNTELCCKAMRGYQKAFIYGTASETGKQDIEFNYLIGQNGVVYEGRGPYVQTGLANLTQGFRSTSINIAIIGKYDMVIPTWETMAALEALLLYMVKQNMTKPNYQIYNRCQVSTTITSDPGSKLFGCVTKIKHWNQTPKGSCDTDMNSTKYTCSMG